MVLAEKGWRCAIGKGMQCLTEAPLPRAFKRSSIGYNAFRSSVCIEAGGAGNVVVSRRHIDGRGRGRCLFVFVAGVKSGAAVVRVSVLGMPRTGFLGLFVVQRIELVLRRA